MQELLSLYVQSLRPIIFIETDDFHSADNEIAKLALTHKAKIREFNIGLGEVDFITKAQKADIDLIAFLDMHKDDGFSDTDKSNYTFLLLKDVHTLIDSEKNTNIQYVQSIISKLRCIAEKQMYNSGYDTTVFIISPLRYIPRELEHLISIVQINKPNQEEIEKILLDYANNQGYEQHDIGDLAIDLKGLSKLQIKQILDLAYCDGGYISKEKDKHRIIEDKKQIIDKSGLLEFIDTHGSLDDIGGISGLKKWLQYKAKIFNNVSHALKYGVSMPKGVLILGVPGCGKSLSAKVAANTFEVPLLRLDLGRILGKYVGESEHNMRRALKLAEGISPCILWIDEIEKAFAGGIDGHDVTVRLIGQFLTWLQELQSTVFVIATANNIKKLPPEFFRKGRFDEIFYVGLPEVEERTEILKIHLKKRHKDIRSINIASFAKKAERFSGADLESLVCTAIEISYFRNGGNLSDSLKNEDFEQAFKLVTASLSETALQDMENAREGCQFRMAKEDYPYIQNFTGQKSKQSHETNFSADSDFVGECDASLSNVHKIISNVLFPTSFSIK